MVPIATWISGAIYGHPDQINGGIAATGPKIHHREPVAYISEAHCVLIFQQYFCISYSGSFLAFYFSIARLFGNAPISTAHLWVFGVIFVRFDQIYGGLLNPLKSNIGTHPLIAMRSTWY